MVTGMASIIMFIFAKLQLHISSSRHSCQETNRLEGQWGCPLNQPVSHAPQQKPVISMTLVSVPPSQICLSQVHSAAQPLVSDNTCSTITISNYTGFVYIFAPLNLLAGDLSLQDMLMQGNVNVVKCTHSKQGQHL